MEQELFGIRGFLIDAPEFGSLRARRDGGIIVENGKIAEVGDYDDLRRTQRWKGVADAIAEEWSVSNT